MDKNVINNIISTCWLDTTHLPIQPTPLMELPDNSQLYIASIVFSGKSQGSMTIAMGELLATKIASMMFDCELDSVSFDDIKDSIGELVNVLAGNLKTDFYGDCELSKPLVIEGSKEILSVLGADVIFQKIYISDNEEKLIIQLCHTD